MRAKDQQVGATRHILGEMDKLIAYYRDRHRLDENVALTRMAPQWVRNLMRADLAYQMAAGDWQDALGVAEQLIGEWFSRRGIAPVWFLDGNPASETVAGVTIPAQTYGDLAAGGTIPEFPGQLRQPALPVEVKPNSRRYFLRSRGVTKLPARRGDWRQATASRRPGSVVGGAPLYPRCP